MAQDYHQSVIVEEINKGARIVITVSTTNIGLVCTADAASFPLNRPVLLTDVLIASG